jgi:hypothetical protein
VQLTAVLREVVDGRKLRFHVEVREGDRRDARAAGFGPAPG